MHLLRHCASMCKLIYTCRTVPPALVAEPLKAYDDMLREAVGAIAGAPTSTSSWQISQLPLNKGGLGLRSPSFHCAAAFLGSVKATADMCLRVDPAFDPSDVSGGLGLGDAFQRLQAVCLPAARAPPASRAFSGSRVAKQCGSEDKEDD